MKRTQVRSPARGPKLLTRDYQKATVPILSEVLCALELGLLHASPVYYGLGAARGDGSAVVLIPGFLCPDHYLFFLHKWLGRIGYRPFFSGIRLNTECPNLLIQRRLNQTIEKALAKTHRKIHLIGHSLGGIIARSIAAQRPQDIASVITLGAPFRGTVAHSAILFAAEAVRYRILKKHGPAVLPDCYTGRCTCDFVDYLQRDMPPSVQETAVYTTNDGVVDWRYCRTDNEKTDFPVSGTHIGLAFNPKVYSIVADRLAQTHCAPNKVKPRRARVASRVKCATT
jgi:pimeloyl-ACP methyl ester carboxylesterase